MAYTYLLELHTLVDGRIEQAENLAGKCRDNPESLAFQKGRVAILSEFKAFITDNFNKKLPKRIRQSLV